MVWTIFYMLVYAFIIGIIINYLGLTGAERVMSAVCGTLVSVILGTFTSATFHEFKEKVG